MDTKTARAPRPEEALGYAQRMREIKEIASGQRPRTRQRKTLAQHQRESARGAGDACRRATGNATAQQARKTREPGESGAQPQRAFAKAGQFDSGIHSEGRSTGVERDESEERSERRRHRGTRQIENDAAGCLDERVRPPRRRARAPRSSDTGSRKVPTFAIVAVSAVTSALVSVGTAAMTSPSGGALSGLIAGGWWM